MITIFPDFVVAVDVMNSILRNTYMDSLMPEYKVNKTILRTILSKVVIIPTECIVNQTEIKNEGIKGISSGYQPDYWNTRHYREYFDAHPELFIPSKTRIFYTLNMESIKKMVSYEKTIRENAIMLCRKMLTHDHYTNLLLIRYGLI